uniref:aldehyde oxygenase (deformylating) n=1 Tax=Oryza glumipatula TaxID=40148 RepID=A0A0D9YSK6_9ORYZ
MATAKKLGEKDVAYLSVLPFMLLRILHSQVWLTISRLMDARGNRRRIVERGIEFEQSGSHLEYLVLLLMPLGQGMPLWRRDGALVMVLMHAGPVEFLSYWFHRALHHHALYSRYHSHHHASIAMALEGEQTPGQATEAAREMDGDGGGDGGEWRQELVAYDVLFAIPVVTCLLTGTISILAYAIYIFYIDFMNNLGHCNFELVPNYLFKCFPPLKYLMYTPSFHSLHHTQFRTNYSLYMPFYDYIYNTMDKSSSTLYESMLKISKEKSLDVVHLTHLTDLQSIYHLRPGFSMFVARGYNQSNWSMITILSPLSWLIAMCTWAFSSSPFAVDRSVLDKNLNMQTWAIPRYSFHYHLKRENKAINDLIGKEIHEADRRGAKVFSLGLLNQGSSLAAAVVSNSVASRTDQVILAGNLDKVARAVAMALCKRNVKIRWEALEVSVAKGIMWRQRGGHRGMDGGDIGDGEARATVSFQM